MVILTKQNQFRIHELSHFPQGMPVSPYGGRGAWGQKSAGNLTKTKLVRTFRGVDGNQWMKLTDAGKAFVEATRFK